MQTLVQDAKCTTLANGLNITLQHDKLLYSPTSHPNFQHASPWIAEYCMKRHFISNTQTSHLFFLITQLQIYNQKRQKCREKNPDLPRNKFTNYREVKPVGLHQVQFGKYNALNVSSSNLKHTILNEHDDEILNNTYITYEMRAAEWQLAFVRIKICASSHTQFFQNVQPPCS